MQHRVFEMELAGRMLSLEVGKLAEQAGGSVIVRCGDTVILVCATVSKTPRDGIDFFPLSVDFEEKLYSVGKIPGGFIKREGRPTEKAILTSRLIDRPIRPLFPKTFRNDVQVVATVLSVDTDIPPDVYAMIGSSAALCLSDAPFAGPTGSVVVGLVDGEYIINPTSEQREMSRMYTTVSGTKDAVMMVEAEAKEVSEEEMLKGILFAHEKIKEIVAFQENMLKELGIEKVLPEPEEKYSPEVEQAVREYAAEKIRWSLDTTERYEREARQQQVKEEVFEHFAETFPESEKEIDAVIYDVTKEIVRDKIIHHNTRPDGRTLKEVRPIWCEVGFLPRPHGSGIFTRGQTQVMTVVTLGAMGEVQKLDGLSDEDMKRYMHHYNMPPYSVGETRPMRSPGRREIGHGALAERALLPMIPSEEEFPYAIRLVSEVVSSNGSTSQASVCGSTLALMDAGVPIKKPVAGVAMGLIKDAETGEIAVMTDIQGLEDFLGDMDFKVAGTKDGITAIQMDIKIKGIDEEILRRALAQALEGRMHILGEMLKTIDAPRDHLSPYAPKIIRFTINPEKIREVIGPGGKMINKIIAETGVKIDIEDDGRVFISTPDEAAAAKARRMIEAIAKDIEVGEIYLGKVVRLMTFGAFVELVPGKDGMVHISKISPTGKRVEKIEDAVKIGDELVVKVNEIDRQGRVNLTCRGITEEERNSVLS
ncbi:polyribonucleotide nucleotidyltransferase [Gehongia tenuis]|uniref:Polyribonucleotide nucleotidyltransferase n=1 Tax=Gehongia tenuis TaxID=2763655 RepID=A0A926D671_9FIRM|nr:polyribonucleotide nucleotidyltransferase [Gehongia tenuis]MBC8531120.1 polyribonucleotide nucleotidyltransferase [Gehongia tenuis]